VCAQVNALEPLAEHFRGEAAAPFVEVAQHQLRHPDATIVHDAAEPSRLVTAFQKRGAEMDVIEVQRICADRHVHTLQTARLARLPGQVVVGVVNDRMSAEHHVAEQIAAQVPRRRHHPAHAQQRTELFGMSF